MKFSETPNCECGKDRESADHFLIHCEEHREARQIMFDAIMNVWMEKKSKGSLNVSKQMLIGLNFSEKLNSNDDVKVKVALFKYLKVTKNI